MDFGACKDTPLISIDHFDQRSTWCDEGVMAAVWHGQKNHTRETHLFLIEKEDCVAKIVGG